MALKNLIDFFKSKCSFLFEFYYDLETFYRLDPQKVWSDLKKQTAIVGKKY